jgi:hypothetical protein
MTLTVHSKQDTPYENNETQKLENYEMRRNEVRMRNSNEMVDFKRLLE